MEAGVPQAVEAACPACGDETLHRVLAGRIGTRGGLTLDATLECDACGRVHHAVLREPPSIDVPVVVSKGGESRRTRAAFPADEPLEVGDELLVEGGAVVVTGLEAKDGLRRERAVAREVGTLWVKDFETVRVRVAINLRRKTIAKEIEARPDRAFSIGQELVFGRLRVEVHAIKVAGRMARRGSHPARDVVRVFARPVRGARLDLPAPPSEEALAGGLAERTARDVEADADDLEAAWDALEDPPEDGEE